jgi:septum formation protein
MSKHHLNPLIFLASASPRRSALLRQIGVTHEIRPVDIDESIAAQEPAPEYVRRLASCKAETLWAQLPTALRRPVLGADTAVVLQGRILGKPRDASDHFNMLQSLSGCTHEVHTAVALRSDRGSEVRHSVSEVTFRALQEEEMVAYWHSGEPVDKAGGYAIQGLGALFVTSIHGSYSGIVGLPLFETGELLGLIGCSLIIPRDTTASRCG